MSDLENIVEKESKKSLSRTIAEKLADPFIELYHVFKDDLGFGQILKNTAETAKRTGLAAFGAISSLPFYILAHESLHSIAYKSLGIGTDYLGVRPEIGGSLMQKIMPFISTNISEFKTAALGLAGAPIFADTSIETAIHGIFPFILTPIGIDLMRKKDKYFLQGAGLLIATAPFRNVFGDMSDISKAVLDSESILLNASSGAVIAALTYITSKYVADGYNAIVNRFKRKNEKQEKILFRRIIDNSKYYIGLTASALILAYLGKPNKPLRQTPIEIERNMERIISLQNDSEHEKTIEFYNTLKKQGYDYSFYAHLHQSFVKLFLSGKMTEQEVLDNVFEKNHPLFYIELSRAYTNKYEFEIALKTLEKINPDHINKEVQKSMDHMKQTIFFFNGETHMNKARNLSGIQAKDHIKKASESYETALEYKTEDYNLIEIINRNLENTKKQLRQFDR